MDLRSTTCQAIGVVLLGLCGLPGCGAPASDTGPTEQPNIGPGFPAAGPTFAAKSDMRHNTSAATASKNATK
jgi:hypothetical protein